MSEGAGEHLATDREERFGHIVFRTWQDDVYSLDLYETHETYAPGIACKGHCIPAIRQHGPDRFRRPVVPGSVPVGVELTADPDAFNEIYEMMGAGTFEREDESRDYPGAPYSALFRLGGGVEVQKPLLLNRAERTSPKSGGDGVDRAVRQQGTYYHGGLRVPP
jgi:hypothetical protein